MSRTNLRRLGAALCALVAGVYALIGAEVITVGEEVEGGGDIRVFGFGAAAIFVVGMALLLRADRRGLWLVGAVVLVMINVMYVAVAGSRTPSFEAWGLALRVPQLALLGILVVLASRRGRSGPERDDDVVDPAVVEDFLAQERFAVVGVSDDPGNFGRTVLTELRSHGYQVAAVHPTAVAVGGEPAYPELADVPIDLDGVIVMVHRDRVLPVIQACIERRIPRVWLFRGVGGAGAVSPAAIELCRSNGIAVVPGACPLMFLQPVGVVHRIHRGARHLTGTLG